MNDELNKLQDAFAKEPEIRASKSAKQAALKAAMNAFEAENLHAPQGSGDAARQKEQNNRLVDLITFSKWRKPMKLSTLLTGAAGLAVLTFVAVNTHQFAQFYRDDERPLPGPVILEKPAKPVASETPVPADANNEAAIASVTGEVQADADAPARAKQQAPTAVARQKIAQDQFVQVAPRAKEERARADRKMMAEKKPAAPAGRSQQAAQLSIMPASSEPRIAPTPDIERGRDQFTKIDSNPVRLTLEQPVSTFSIDVDTASYSFMRASLNQNRLPPKDAVRIEELINYFPYDYAVPDSSQQPFGIHTSVLPTPWNEHTRLLHIGIKGYDTPRAGPTKSNLVFLVDTSGSMHASNKLPLLRQSFKLLLSSLTPDDTISIVAYAGSAGTVLEPTEVRDKARILSALDQLAAGGSTAGGEGIRLAYQLAEMNFDSSAVNRVILATDGDFNVGIRNPQELKSFIERKRDTGVYLSVLGFGMGNYNDALMQTLAQNGNGNAAYIDSLSEARKVLVEEASSTLFPIAKDVKIQIEFNPETVSEYRLIGYETRHLEREDFNNDQVDAGEIGAGHSVTAIYEITPTGSAGALFDPLRYQAGKAQQPGREDRASGEYGFLKLRYKLPDEAQSRLIEQPIKVAEQLNDLAKASDDVRFAVAVAAFGQLLRGGQYTGNFSYDDVIELALDARGRDIFGYRAEFINLVRLAKTAAAM